MVADLFAGPHQDPLRLFRAVVNQVARNLKGFEAAPVIASYFTRVEPLIFNEPFCVALAEATVFFHMQLNHAAETDVVLYGQLLAHGVSLIPLRDVDRHPLIRVVIRELAFGLDGEKRHYVVLTPPQCFRAFATLAATLVYSGALPHILIQEWWEQLDRLSNAASPMVSFRAQRLLLRTSDAETVEDSMRALQETLQRKPKSLNMDFILLCFERLQRVVQDVVNGPPFWRALCVICSEIFLRFRSPIRRQYVECFLFPSLANADTRALIEAPGTRAHLCRELLQLCTPSMTPSCPYYACLCLMIHPNLTDATSAAEEIVRLCDSLMPHGAYFLATMALDKNVTVALYAEMVQQLVKSAGYVMNGRTFDGLTAAMDSSTMVYNVFYAIREVVARLGGSNTTRSDKVMRALRSAVPVIVLNTLGQFAASAFDGICEIPIEPQLLCAELGLTLHEHNIDEAVDSVLEYVRDATAICHFCNQPKASSAVCSMNGTIHLMGHAPFSRVLLALANCAGSPRLQQKLIKLINAQPMDRSVHFIVFQLLHETKQFRAALYAAVEPYVSGTLSHLSATRADTTSNDRANLVVFHTKLIWLLGGIISPQRVLTVVKAFSRTPVANNQDALVLWYAANFLLRNSCADNVDLAPLSLHEMDEKKIPQHTAQLLLHYLDRAHSYSDETRKLTGPCVAKLVQDFNMQAPNIIQSLLAPFGAVTCAAESLVPYALPTHPSTTFWSFVLRQLHQSPPMRTSMIVSLVKSISARFRCDHPSRAMVDSGVEPTAPLFVAMTFEVVKRSPPLAQMMLQLMLLWVAQGHHAPGKYTCLIYTCEQLLENILESRDFLHEKRTSTGSNSSIDTLINSFEHIIEQTKANLAAQVPILRNLVQRVAENAEFSAVVAKVCDGVEHAVVGAAATAPPPPSEPVDSVPQDDATLDDAVAAAETVEDDDYAEPDDADDGQPVQPSATAEALAEPSTRPSNHRHHPQAATVPSTKRNQLPTARDAGVSIPSDVVFELLSSVQSFRSVMFELQQMDISAATTATVVQPFVVAMESRENNYSEPHNAARPAPTRRVLAALGAQEYAAPGVSAAVPLREISADVPVSFDRTRFLAQQQSRDSIMHELRGIQRASTGDDGRATADVRHRGIPIEFVEQGHDTVLRELRQMTSARGSKSFGRQTLAPATSTAGFAAAIDENAQLMYAPAPAPIPLYATEQQYSLEFL